MHIKMEMIDRPIDFVNGEFGKNNSITPSDIENLYLDICTNYHKQIQSLNKFSISELNAGRVVHFRCMVQDMYDSEFFFKIYNINNKESGVSLLKCGLYQDIIQHNDDEEFIFDSTRNKYGDRQVLYCIPIPGENIWAKTAHNSKFADDVKDDATGSSNRMKRKHDDDDDDYDDFSGDKGGVEMDVDVCLKRLKPDDHKEGEEKCYNYKENFPLPNELGYPAIVKVYNMDARIKLNDIIDVFGVLSLDSNVSDVVSRTTVCMECDDDVELRARNPHPIIVPRLHALVVRRLENEHPFRLSPVLNDLEGSLARCREQVVAIFGHCFHGDELAAEYLLCHLFSGVYSRREMTALGKFSLNISNIPQSPSFVNDLYQILSQLLVKSHLFPMTLENMNKLDFVPCKDYDENRLKPGILQLSNRTHLVVDETSLQPGKLEGKGILNMAALSNLVEKQELDYNFMFHNQTFQTDVRVLVLSEGKSILKCDCHVPMVSVCKNQSPTDLKIFLTNPILDLIRAYICHSEDIVPTLPQEVQEAVEKDFVENRKNEADKMVPEDLHASLVLARCVALSHGSKVISLDHWRRTREIEKMRKERVKLILSEDRPNLLELLKDSVSLMTSSSKFGLSKQLAMNASLMKSLLANDGKQ